MKATRFRFDLVVFAVYEAILFYSVNQLLVVFLEYAPKELCDAYVCEDADARCFKENGTSVCGIQIDKKTHDETEICVEGRDNTTIYFNSAAMEYHYYCDTPFLRSFTPTTAQYTGVMIGGLFLGFLADKFGRKTTVLGSILIGAPATVLAAVGESIWFYYLMRFIAGICVSGTMSVGWSYSSEMIRPQHRLHLRTYSNWANVRMVLVLIAWSTGEWRRASYVFAAVCLIPVAMLCWLPESPTWLRKKGKLERAEKARLQINWICGFDPDAPDELEDKTNHKSGETKLGDIFTNRILRTRVLVMWLMWFSVGLIVYIFDVNSADLSENLWWSQISSCFVYFSIQVTVGIVDSRWEWLGRRRLFMFGMAMCLVGSGLCVLCHYAGAQKSLAYTVSYLIAYGGSIICWTPCFLGTSELIPTELRAHAASVSNALARLGAVLSTQTVRLKEYHGPIMFYIAMLQGLIVIIVVFIWLPETKGIRLEAVTVSEATIADTVPPSKSKSKSGEVDENGNNKQQEEEEEEKMLKSTSSQQKTDEKEDN